MYSFYFNSIYFCNRSKARYSVTYLYFVDVHFCTYMFCCTPPQAFLEIYNFKPTWRFMKSCLSLVVYCAVYGNCCVVSKLSNIVLFITPLLRLLLLYVLVNLRCKC